MNKEVPRNLKVGDVLHGGWTVVDTKYAQQGAIGLHNDTPEFLERVNRALEAYKEAVRRDKFGPWTKEEIEKMLKRQEAERKFNFPPVFDSSINFPLN